MHERLLCYRRLDGEYFGWVVVEAGRKGMEFFESQYGEVRWYSFSPCDVERALIERHIKEKKVTRDWALVVDMQQIRGDAKLEMNEGESAKS